MPEHELGATCALSTDTMNGEWRTLNNDLSRLCEIAQYHLSILNGVVVGATSDNGRTTQRFWEDWVCSPRGFSHRLGESLESSLVDGRLLLIAHGSSSSLATRCSSLKPSPPLNPSSFWTIQGRQGSVRMGSRTSRSCSRAHAANF